MLVTVHPKKHFNSLILHENLHEKDKSQIVWNLQNGHKALSQVVIILWF